MWDWLERIENGINKIDKIKANEMNKSRKQDDNQKAVFFSNVHKSLEQWMKNIDENSVCDLCDIVLSIWCLRRKEK